jgi:hypothetical protein
MASRGSVLSFFSLFCIGLFFFFAPSLSAQITSEKGAIRIALTDPQGGTIAAAKVSITSKTGTAQSKESSPDGSVVFPLLDPGVYDVTVESPNFRRSVLHDVAVHVTEVTNISVVMELGEVSSEVVVAGDAVQTVDTSNATLGNVYPWPLAISSFCLPSTQARPRLYPTPPSPGMATHSSLSPASAAPLTIS